MTGKTKSSSGAVKPHWTDAIPLWPMVIGALAVGLAPFFPEPHLVEKARWLYEGHPFTWLDVLDVPWHLWPSVLLGFKFWHMARAAKPSA